MHLYDSQSYLHYDGAERLDAPVTIGRGTSCEIRSRLRGGRGRRKRTSNDELTVILSSVSDSLESLEKDHPARVLLLDLQRAAQRCMGKAAGLLQFQRAARNSPPARRR